MRLRSRIWLGAGILLAVLAGSTTAITVTARPGADRIADSGADAELGPDRAVRLVTATMPSAQAFEPELAAYVGQSGLRIDPTWSPAGTSVSCDLVADPPLAAERYRIAVASTAYATSSQRREPTGQPDRLFLTAVAMARPGADRLLDELADAVPHCQDNPLSALSRPALGTLARAESVVFRAGFESSGADPAVTCIVAREDTVFLRSCGLSEESGKADELALRGLDELGDRLDQARHMPELPRPPAGAEMPTWAHNPTVAAPKATAGPVCSALTSADVAAATGQQVISFDAGACRWRLAAGSVDLLTGTFGAASGRTRTVLRGNSAMFGEPADGQCSYQVAVSRDAVLQVIVNLRLPQPRPCAVARTLLGLAFDRLPPA